MKRSKWKGLIGKFKSFTVETRTQTKVARSNSITPQWVGRTVSIYNGITFKNIVVSKEMLSHKFGEFSKTRLAFGYKNKKKKK